MQKHFSVFMKLMVTVLLFGVASFAKAATVTYSLTTKVDGRTITATANLNAGDNLNDKMPQTLWRAYTTYKYYSDADLTQEITEAPASGGTVYVDYEFDPPFTVSEDGQDPVWHYLKHNPGTGPDDLRYVYYCEYRAQLYHKYGQNADKFFYTQRNLNTGSQTLKNKKNAQWAFYGDAYCLNLKFNDVNNKETNDFMVCIVNKNYHLETGEKMTPGWQLYVNDAFNGSFSLGLPDNANIDRLVWLRDVGGFGQIKNLSNESDCGRSSKNHVTNTDSQGQGWDECGCYSFLATPITDPSSSLDAWHVTYKLVDAAGNPLANDIVKAKDRTNTTEVPVYPDDSKLRTDEGYTYIYYHDAALSQEWQDNEYLPIDKNTTVWVKESKLISKPWRTLVLPFGITDTDAYFGEVNGAPGVRVAEYTSVDATLTEVGEEAYYNFHMNFTPTTTIEAYKPYFFKADNVEEVVYNNLFVVDDNSILDEAACEANQITLSDPSSSDVTVTMRGVLNPNGYPMDASDGMKFYFGSVKNGEEYAYNFYRVSATIPQYVCYFFITDGRGGAGAKLQVVFDSEVNSINTQIADKSAKGNIYNVNGQLMGTQKSNLPKGLYIVNGKKVVIK